MVRYLGELPLNVLPGPSIGSDDEISLTHSHTHTHTHTRTQYLLGGLAEIDVEDWKRNTEYNGYWPNDKNIVWFWKAVENYDTGTSKVPMNGFAELQGSQGLRKFCIKRYGNPNSLPRAHTW